MKKKRKMGTPRRKRKKARRDTTPRTTPKIRADPLDNATLYDLEQLVREAPPEVEYLIVEHHIRRPGDDPRYQYERQFVINKSTGETRHYVRRKGEIAWSYEDNAAPQPRTSAKNRS
jgi:hypothetical protein